MPSKAQAILAAVPLKHLESGSDVCRVRGSVIFGSDLYGLFEERGVEEGATVYIYASLSGEKPRRALVTWEAEYVRYVRHEEMGREETKRRPPSTEQAGETSWVGFWEVRALRPLGEEEQFPISDLSREDGSPFSPVFIPHGPVGVTG